MPSAVSRAHEEENLKFKFWQLAALVLGAIVLYNLLQPKSTPATAAASQSFAYS